MAIPAVGDEIEFQDSATLKERKGTVVLLESDVEIPSLCYAYLKTTDGADEDMKNDKAVVYDVIIPFSN